MLGLPNFPTGHRCDTLDTQQGFCLQDSGSCYALCNEGTGMFKLVLPKDVLFYNLEQHRAAADLWLSLFD